MNGVLGIAGSACPRKRPGRPVSEPLASRASTLLMVRRRAAATAGSSLAMPARKAARRLIASGDHIGADRVGFGFSSLLPRETTPSLTTAFDTPWPRSREAITRLMPATCHSTDRLCCEKGAAAASTLGPIPDSDTAYLARATTI